MKKPTREELLKNKDQAKEFALERRKLEAQRLHHYLPFLVSGLLARGVEIKDIPVESLKLYNSVQVGVKNILDKFQEDIFKEIMQDSSKLKE